MAVVHAVFPTAGRHGVPSGLRGRLSHRKSSVVAWSPWCSIRERGHFDHFIIQNLFKFKDLKISNLEVSQILGCFESDTP